MLAWRQSAFATGRTPISDRKLRLFACACARQVWPLLRDDAPCGRCGGRGWTREREETSGNYHETTCPDCQGTGRVNRSRRAVEVAERYADGLATGKERVAAWNDASDACEAFDMPDHRQAFQCAVLAQRAVRTPPNWEKTHKVAPALQAALLRDVVGNPFRPVALCRRNLPCDRLCRCLLNEWLTPTVVSLAEAAYEERVTLPCGRCGGKKSIKVPRLPKGLVPALRPDCRGSGEGPSGLLDPARLLVLRDALLDAGCDSADILDHLANGIHVRGCWVLDLVLGKG